MYGIMMEKSIDINNFRGEKISMTQESDTTSIKTCQQCGQSFKIELNYREMFDLGLIDRLPLYCPSCALKIPCNIF